MGFLTLLAMLPGRVPSKQSVAFSVSIWAAKPQRPMARSTSLAMASRVAGSRWRSTTTAEYQTCLTLPLLDRASEVSHCLYMRAASSLVAPPPGPKMVAKNGDMRCRQNLRCVSMARTASTSSSGMARWEKRYPPGNSIVPSRSRMPGMASAGKPLMEMQAT